YEYFAPYHIPVLFGLPIGHISPNIGIPLGATATINTNNKTVSISSGIATPCSN
ncbi:TPA: LD-carboxypeptidase, partial [Bacillus thuringiensis]|nr:LD-carboxypeptidase [Bacillus thuringiensis]